MARPYRNNTCCAIQLVFLSLSSILLISLICGVDCNDDQLQDSYKVGVFEHEVISTRGDVDTRKKALEAMKKNIDVYNQTAIKAKSQGVKLLVFPEYGIYGVSLDRAKLKIFAESIADPNSKKNPCQDSDFQDESKEIQRLLSCIAKENEMFIVANMAGREPCSDGSKCQNDTEYFHNTNVVFSPKGEVVARYYKTHLYNEGSFDPAKSPEAAIFDTPFGKFATFICFDVLFEKPAIELVEKYQIRNIAYSAAWVKVTPVFRSIQTHSGFARETQTNFLVSNRHREHVAFGSGIYTPNGAEAYYYQPDDGASKLIVSDIHQIKDVKPNKKIETDFDISNDPNIKNDTNLGVIATGAEVKFMPLESKSGSVTVCEKTFCCKAYYEIEGPFNEKYALGVYNDIMEAVGNKMYLQMCTLLKCQDSICGSEITDVDTVFSNITLQATGFLSKYLFPSVLAMDGKSYKLVPDDWTYSDEEGLQSKSGKTIKLHSANLLARVYSKDITVRGNEEGENKTNGQKGEKTNGQNVEKTTGQNVEKTTGQNVEKTTGQNVEKTTGQDGRKTNSQNEEKKTNGQNFLGKSSVTESFKYMLYFVVVYFLANF